MPGVIPGFDYDDCIASTADRIAQTITWKESSTQSLAGRVIRFEFYLKNADLYTFRAVTETKE